MEMSLMAMLSAASTAMSAIGAISQANSAKGAAEYNAAIMEQNAATERQQAGQREDAQRREARMVMGEQRAAYSQAGVGLAGSAADVMQQSAATAELDALTLRYEGDLRARGLMAQAVGERAAGRSARNAGYLSAAGTVLGGVGGYMQGRENARLRQGTLSNQRASLSSIQ